VRVLLASPLDSHAIELLRDRHPVECEFGASESRLCALVPDREAIVFRSGVSISSAVIDAAPELRLLVRAGSGLDNVDVERARARGVRLVRVPGPSAQAVAEFTFALMLSLLRNVAHADRLLRDGHWPKTQLGGPLVAGKTLGIVGAGNIGSRVGELAAAWGMNVLGCVESANGNGPALAAKGIVRADLETVLSTADVVTLHVPLTERTRHLIGEQALAQMKPGSFLVNVARGGVVDEAALLTALEAGHIAGAALDVHEREGEGTISPFAGLPNVVLTPHIGAMAADSQREIGMRVLEVVDAFTRGRLEEVTNDGELVA
jgi:D-3-phosphoglycerate dehydrogenase / 2-oxoglutarate reductase